MDRSGGDPEDIQVPCMASLEGLKWTSILVLFGRASCVSFGTSTRCPLNVPLGRPQVRYGRSIDVQWTSTCPLGPNFLMSKKHLIKFDILDFFIRQKQPPEVSMWKGVLSNITKFTEKHLCQRIFFNKKSLY